MPLIELKEVTRNRLLGIFKIEEPYSELLNSLDPAPLDREMLTSYANTTKRSEWVAARLLLRILCEHMNISFNGTRNDSNGKPFLQGHAMEISLSHSYPYIAVIADPEKEVGIDLEQPRSKLKYIAPRFLDDRELELCQNDIIRLSSFWCAKEALYKIYSKKGLNFKNEIHLYPLDDAPWKKLDGIIHKNGNESVYSIQCDYGEDHTLAYNI